jgi:hypothetical protein
MVGLNHEMARELLWNEYLTGPGAATPPVLGHAGATVPAAGLMPCAASAPSTPGPATKIAGPELRRAAIPAAWWC